MRMHKHQMNVIRAPLDATIFLEGTAGTGKSTVGYRRLRQLVDEGVPPEQILILVPQRALGFPYEDEIDNLRSKGGLPTVATIGSLSLQMVELFWALVAQDAGFAHPDKPPVFLSLEMVQYYMTHIVGPEIDRNDYFNSVNVNRNRLYSQIVDNLNKAAVVGFPYTEIGERLTAAWRGDATQRMIYDDAQTSASLFRQFCLANNLLDFSLQMEVFQRHIWAQDVGREYLTSQFRHLIVDNLEEDNPATHSILRDWLGECDSALLIYDRDAGYRRFLGSDPVSAAALKSACDEQIVFDRSFVMSDDLHDLDNRLAEMFELEPPHSQRKGDARHALAHTDSRYHPQMVDWTAGHIAALVQEEGVPLREIVVLAPLLSDALRFSLVDRLDEYGIPVRTHRPSRALRDEPAARALLTLAKLAHPAWNLVPASFDVTYALMATIRDLDLTRARLMTEVLYRSGKLSPFTGIKNSTIQERITFAFGERYQVLFDWLDAYRQDKPLEIDFFFSRLFGDVLSQPRFGFHDDFDAASTAANLVESARNFRWTVTAVDPVADVGRDYVDMVDRGVIADFYVRDWDMRTMDAVLIAPAYTYLMSNQPVDYQFWLSVGGSTWAQRLYQPLTHPHVLSKQWSKNRVWTDDDEERAMMDALYRLAAGLIRRCRKRVYLGISQFSETGYEQTGPLLDVMSRILRTIVQEEEAG